MIKQNAYRPLAQLIVPGWSEDTVIANGIRQHVYRTGRGRRPPVVLLHGFMENGISWLRVAKALAADYDVIMPDARAHGRSAGPEGDFTPELLADDVAALLETLKLERPFLIGRSNGAVTAVLVAAAHPDRVRGLVLEEPPAGGMPRPTIRQEQVQQQNWFQAWLQWMQRLEQMPHQERLASAIARWPHGLPVPPDEPLWPEDDFVPYVTALAQFKTDIFRQKIGYWSLVSYLEQAAGLTCPVLLVAGNPEIGSLVPEETAAELAASWPQGQVVRVAEAGHIISRGRPSVQFMGHLQSLLDTWRL
jgi:pimeloyl-ACP methyl ester carboxylesterase